MGADDVTKMFILSSCCPFFVLSIEHLFFGKFQSFLSMVVKQLSCDFGVFVRQGVLKSFYFTVFSRTK